MLATWIRELRKESLKMSLESTEYLEAFGLLEGPLVMHLSSLMIAEMLWMQFVH